MVFLARYIDFDEGAGEVTLCSLWCARGCDAIELYVARSPLSLRWNLTRRNDLSLESSLYKQLSESPEPKLRRRRVRLCTRRVRGDVKMCRC